MDYHNVYNAYFSPSGTTKKITSSVASVISDKITAIDFLCKPIDSLHFENDDLLIIGLPVFSGRVPQNCIPYIKSLQGNGTPAIIIVVYGNRDYEDALIELYDLIHAQNFCVIGAAAFVAEHSLFHQVAQGRPDNNDFSKIIQFATICSEKLESFEGYNEQLRIEGNRPYKSRKIFDMHPKTLSNCNSCGICADICPTGAIDSKNTLKTAKDKCISCTACVSACPIGARSFKGFRFNVSNRAFIKKYSDRIESEWFT